MKCVLCGAELDKTEIGLSKKLINRATENCLCLNCLANKYNVTTELLLEKAQQFKKMGCSLF